MVEIAEGTGVVIAQYLGKDNKYSVNEIVQFAIYISLIIGFFLTIFVTINSSLIMGIITNDD